MVGVAAVVEVDGGGTCTSARIGVTGAAPSAFRAEGAEQKLVGNKLDADAMSEAARGIAEQADLLDDLSASASYRAHLCEVMAGRALTQAAERMK